VLQTTKGPEAALPAVEEFAGKNWWHFESHLMLAHMLASAGDYAGSVELCRETATLDIHNPAPYEQEAKANVLANRYPEALEAQTEAMERGADGPAEYMMLAAIYSQMNEPGKAAAAEREATLVRGKG
jgi:predicted Zn-dependent protease